VHKLHKYRKLTTNYKVPSFVAWGGFCFRGVLSYQWCRGGGLWPKGVLTGGSVLLGLIRKWTPIVCLKLGDMRHFVKLYSFTY